MAPTSIHAIHYRPLDLILNEPFSIATGAQAVAQNVLVAVELADGTTGWGEAAPFEAVTGETQQQTLVALNRLQAILVEEDVRSWRSLAALLYQAEPKAAAARCALETALLDALTRQIGLPLWAFFGGVGTELHTDMTITTGSVEHAESAARAITARGISTIKIKIGGDRSVDLERITAVHQAVPSAPLILDGNCGYDASSARDLLAALRERAIPVALFEQPTAREDWQGLQEITQHGGVLVGADESVTTAEDALRAARSGAVGCVNIKLMKSGIAQALDIAAICRAAGIVLMIGGMVESLLAMTVSAHFAAGQGGFQFIDLDTPMFMREQPFTGGWHQTGDRLSVAHIAAGHGVQPAERMKDEG